MTSDDLLPKAPLFPSTHWSSIEATRKTGTASDLQALGKLLMRYESTLLWYLKSKFSYSREEAQDLFQDFIHHRVVKKELFAKIQPLKGHQFRKFLLLTLHTFVVSQYRRRNALKRRPVNGLTSLDEFLETQALPAEPHHSKAFDVEWAKEVVARALHRMHEECKATRRMDIWGVFNNRLRKPILEGHVVQPYDELVQEFGFNSPSQAHNALVTGKRAFAKSLHAVVAEYTLNTSAIDQEIRELQFILSHAE
jgi:hypothetical protein